ncbi:UNVERIFIED_CONTAM: helix-turn-helix domain-containing protein, partial [Prevotella sp. 15_C9]
MEMESEYGKKDFFVPYEKYFHNVEQSSNLRGMHSYILHMFPLQADSLNRIWYRLLEEMNYSGKTVVRISVADWDER